MVSGKIDSRMVEAGQPVNRTVPEGFFGDPAIRACVAPKGQRPVRVCILIGTMHTDKLFYRLFQERPATVFELAGLSVPEDMELPPACGGD